METLIAVVDSCEDLDECGGTEPGVSFNSSI